MGRRAVLAVATGGLGLFFGWVLLSLCRLAQTCGGRDGCGLGPSCDASWTPIESAAAREIAESFALAGGPRAAACPDRSWLREARSCIGGAFTLIEVGCHQGYEAVERLRLFTGDAKWTKRAWMAAGGFGEDECGPCDECRGDAEVDPSWPKVTSYAHHCLTASPERLAALERARAGVAAGTRQLQVELAAWAAGGEPGGVDDYAERRRVGHVDALVVRGDGEDARVLLGAARTLAAHRPRYLEFEAGGSGHWASYELRDLVDFLAGRGFTCFWAGRGALWRITGGWTDEYARRPPGRGGTVACHHRDAGPLGRAMEATANATLPPPGLEDPPPGDDHRGPAEEFFRLPSSGGPDVETEDMAAVEESHEGMGAPAAEGGGRGRLVGWEEAGGAQAALSRAVALRGGGWGDGEGVWPGRGAEDGESGWQRSSSRHWSPGGLPPYGHGERRRRRPGLQGWGYKRARVGAGGRMGARRYGGMVGGNRRWRQGGSGAAGSRWGSPMPTLPTRRRVPRGPAS